MPTPDSTNLIAGTLTQYLAEYGEALPELDDLTPPAITVTPAGNWTRGGFTLDAQTLEYEGELQEVRVNESPNVITTHLVTNAATFKARYAERDLANFADAIGGSALSAVSAGADQTAQDQLTVGAASPTKKAMLLVGANPEGGTRIFHMPAVWAKPMFNLSHTRQHEGYDAEFIIGQDTTNVLTSSVLFTIYDITAVASS